MQNQITFNPDTDFNMNAYCAARHLIEQNSSAASVAQIPKEDIDFIVKAILDNNGPVSLSIWAHLQATRVILFAVHPHISAHMVQVATNGDALTQAYFKMSDKERDAWKLVRDHAYHDYIVSLGQKV